ncbi:MAG: MobQ family relaxase [Phormidesmis sp.]
MRTAHKVSPPAHHPVVLPERKGALIRCYATVRWGEAPRPLGEESRSKMAIFSMRMQVIGRSAGRSATAAAAYRAGEQIADGRTGRVHDYTGKSDIYGSEILLPEGAPERLGDRVVLWNEVERVEKRKDAQLSREVMIALPAELSHWQKQALAREYVQSEFVSEGMIADIGYHDFDSHNPHAHIMLTMRSVDQEGFGKKKREWNKRPAIEAHRQAWAEHTNQALERAGYAERIDHRSLEDQGVEREPQIHLGAKVMEMESRGISTQVGAESRRISKVNRDIARQKANRERLRTSIKLEQTLEQISAVTAAISADYLEPDSAAQPGSDQRSSPARFYDPVEPDSQVESTRTYGVAETVIKGVDSEFLERVKARLAEAEMPEPPVEKKQEEVKQKEQPQQRQKKRVKERDQEMEL